VPDSPYEIEAPFDFLNRGDDGVDEKCQAYGAQQFAAHVRDELHHALGQLCRRAADGTEEFMNDEPQVPARAETLIIAKLNTISGTRESRVV